MNLLVFFFLKFFFMAEDEIFVLEFCLFICCFFVLKRRSKQYLSFLLFASIWTFFFLVFDKSE